MLFNTESVRAAATGFRAMFWKGFEGASVLYKSVCLDIASTGAREELVIPEGLGTLEHWVGPRQVDTAIRWTVVIVNKTWQKTLGVPREAYEDDNLGIYSGQAEMLGVAAAVHPDSLLSSAIIDGFTREGYDGVPFFSANHPINGAVQSNLVSGALSASTFRTALANLQGMRDYWGAPLKIGRLGMKLQLMVGPSNRATAKSIVGLATTASGAGNPDYEEAEVVINEDFVGDYANYWCLVASGGPIRPFVFQMRRKAALTMISSPESEEVFKNNRILHGVDGRWNLGYGFYQLIQGSTGA